MAFGSGKNTKVTVKDSGAVVRDISTYCDNVDFPREAKAEETTTYQVTGSARTWVPGLNNSTITMRGKFDAVLHGYLTGIYGFASSRTVVFGPLGGTSGLPRATAEALLLKYTVHDPVDGVVTWDAEFQITGAVTDDTWP